jgi:uncharacterized membrane protein
LKGIKKATFYKKIKLGKDIIKYGVNLLLLSGYLSLEGATRGSRAIGVIQCNTVVIPE